MMRHVYAQKIDSPLGVLLAAATDKGICLLDFIGEDASDKAARDIAQRLDAELLWAEHDLLSQLSAQLSEYFLGQRRHFDIPLHVLGTEFQNKAWQALCAIPYGTTTSYAAQAIATGNPKAVRAVARANSQNRIAIVIPCHRAIGADGSLTGYAGGLWRKQKLLEIEGVALLPAHKGLRTVSKSQH